MALSGNEIWQVNLSGNSWGQGTKILVRKYEIFYTARVDSKKNSPSMGSLYPNNFKEEQFQ